MSEQPALTFGELLRQLRAASRLTQEELAEAAQVSARSVSDLERGVNRTARKVTAELLAQVLGLTGQSRELFVAAARGFGPAEDVLIALRSLPGADGLPASGRQAGRPASQWAMTESPYRGMRAFGEQHEEMFGGREAAAAQVLERLARLAAGAGTLEVSGVSGAGKTSLLQAGVLPQIRRAGLAAAPAAASWPCLVFSPGYDPLAELAVRVAPLIGVDAPVLRDRLAEVPAGFALPARQAAPDGRLLLVIDQCEQLFTLCESGAWRQAFVAALQAASAPPHPGALVVLVVRADFEARLADFPELGTAVQDRYLLTAMTARQLQLAITRPAEAVGARVDDDLVQVLLAEVRERRGAVAASGGQAGAGVLPLLSHALDQAWRTRAGPMLSLADYERTGGIQGAVAVSAQRGYDQLTPTQQEAARQVFTRLTAAGEDGTDTAARTARADLIAGRDAAGVKDVEVVLETFTAERLLTLDAATVEITHEALLTAWPLLRDTWLTDARADRAARTRLSASAAEWTAANRDAAYLYHGSRLDAAVATSARIEADPRHAPLSQAETDFLGASRRSGRRRPVSSRPR